MSIFAIFLGLANSLTTPILSHFQKLDHASGVVISHLQLAQDRHWKNSFSYVDSDVLLRTEPGSRVKRGRSQLERRFHSILSISDDQAFRPSCKLALASTVSCKIYIFEKSDVSTAYFPADYTVANDMIVVVTLGDKQPLNRLLEGVR